MFGEGRVWGGNVHRGVPGIVRNKIHGGDGVSFGKVCIQVNGMETLSPLLVTGLETYSRG